jgi:hypothetical protein
VLLSGGGGYINVKTESGFGFPFQIPGDFSLEDVKGFHDNRRCLSLLCTMVVSVHCRICFGFRWLENRGMFHRVGTDRVDTAGNRYSLILLKCCCVTCSTMPVPKRQEERTGTHRYHGETEGWRMDQRQDPKECNDGDGSARDADCILCVRVPSKAGALVGSRLTTSSYMKLVPEVRLNIQVRIYWKNDSPVCLFARLMAP